MILTPRLLRIVNTKVRTVPTCVKERGTVHASKSGDAVSYMTE
jgi:hypothetical protein